MQSIEQIQANQNAKYHLQRLIAFAQCNKLQATERDINEALQAMFNDDVTEVHISFARLVLPLGECIDPDVDTHCTIERTPCLFGGKRTKIEFL